MLGVLGFCHFLCLHKQCFCCLCQDVESHVTLLGFMPRSGVGACIFSCRLTQQEINRCDRNPHVNTHIRSFIGDAEEKKAAKAEQDRLRALKGKGPAQPEEDEDDDDEDADVVSVPFLLRSTTVLVV